MGEGDEPAGRRMRSESVGSLMRQPQRMTRIITRDFTLRGGIPDLSWKASLSVERIFWRSDLGLEYAYRPRPARSEITCQIGGGHAPCLASRRRGATL